MIMPTKLDWRIIVVSLVMLKRLQFQIQKTALVQFAEQTNNNMKKLIILFLILLPLTMYSQEAQKPDYKQYKACTECFDHWEKSSPTGLESYGLTQSSSKREGYAKQQAKRFFGAIAGIFIVATTYVVYNKVNNVADAIH